MVFLLLFFAPISDHHHSVPDIGSRGVIITSRTLTIIAIGAALLWFVGPARACVANGNGHDASAGPSTSRWLILSLGPDLPYLSICPLLNRPTAQLQLRLYYMCCPYLLLSFQIPLTIPILVPVFPVLYFEARSVIAWPSAISSGRQHVHITCHWFLNFYDVYLLLSLQTTVIFTVISLVIRKWNKNKSATILFRRRNVSPREGPSEIAWSSAPKGQQVRLQANL